MITYLGSLSTAELFPIVGLTLATAIADLQGQITALGSASVAINPGGIAGTIALLGQILAALEAALTAGVVPPSVSFQADALLGLQVKLEALLELQAQMQAGGIHALAYAGRADEFATELSGATAGLPGVSPSDNTRALALVATTPAALAALEALI